MNRFENGKWVTRRTEEEVLKELQAEMSRLSPEEQIALQTMLAEELQGTPKSGRKLIQSLEDLEYERVPVDPLTFIEDPYYLGEVGNGMFPRLKQDFVRLFTGSYEECVLTGSIGLDSLVQEADGGLPTLEERIGRVKDVLVLKESGLEVSTTEPAHRSGIKPVLRILLANGMRLDLTPEHEVQVYRDGVVWVEASEIREGDLVLTARRVRTTPSSALTADEARLLAYWCGDGSFSDTRARFCDGNPKTSIEVLELLKKLGYDGTHYPKGNNCWEVSVRSVKKSGFLAWVRAHCGDKKTADVVVPDAVCRASDSVVAAFLNRLWACEGTVYASEKSPPRFALGMISERFVRQIQLLLLRFGIQARIRKTNYVDKRNGCARQIWHLAVSGVSQLSAFLESVGTILGKEDACARITSYCDARKANTNVDLLPVTWGNVNQRMREDGIVRPRGNRWWNLGMQPSRRMSRSMFGEWSETYGSEPVGQALLDEFPADIGYEPVTRIESLRLAIPVGDIGAHNGHRFIANGMSVHNSIGWGKTFFATLAIDYVLYTLTCLRSPAETYGLAAGSQLHIVNLSARKDTAQRVVFEGIADKLSLSPYFREIGMERRKEELRFPKNIVVLGGESTDTSVLGLSVCAAVMDETNFLRGQVNRANKARWHHYGKAESLYTAIKTRMQSRFLKMGNLPGLLVLVSSRQVPDDFTEVKIRSAQDDPKVFVVDYALWDVKTDNYSKETFKVYVGAGGQKPRILEPGEEMPVKEGERLVEIPVDFKKRFEDDLAGSLRDIAGVSVVTVTTFLQARDKLFAVIDKTRPHPFSQEEWDPSIEGKFLWDKLVRTNDRGEMEPKNYPGAIRYVAIDPSISGDATGFAMGCVCGFKKVVRKDEDGKEFEEDSPLIWIDCILKIVPPKGGEIFLGDVRNLIYQLSERGFPISRVSLDSFQSADSIQQLRLKGYTAELVSVDSSIQPYQLLKGTIYEGRLDVYNYAPLIEELKSLEMDWERRKVDHPISGSKDCADAVCALVWSLSQKFSKNGANVYGAPPMMGISQEEKEETYVPADSKHAKAGQILWGDDEEEERYIRDQDKEEKEEMLQEGELPPFFTG